MDFEIRQTGDSPIEVAAAVEIFFRENKFTERLCLKFRAEVIRTFDRGFSTFGFDSDLITKYPFLDDLQKLRRGYIEAMQVVESPDGSWNLIVSKKILEEYVLPADLPFLLEYGDPFGVKAIPHWSPAELWLMHNYKDLEKEITDEL